MILLGQDVLREKQQHIEQLLKERDLERAEITRAASQADEAEQKFYTLKHEFEQYRSQCEQKVRESDDILSKLKVDRDELLSQLEDEKRKNEDLQFRFEEASITKSDIEATSEGYVKRIKELEAKLEEDRHKAEQLEATSNKLFEAEEGLIKAREEIEALRKDLEQTRTKRETLEEDKTATTQLVESLQKQVDRAKAENEEKLKTISQLTEEVSKIKAENCEKENEQVEKFKHELDHQRKLLEKFGQTHADLAKENEKLKMDLSARAHDLEVATDELAAKDKEIKSLRDELETVRKELGHKTDDLERQRVNLHEVEANLEQARGELKEKITEVENTKKECNLQVSQKDQQISDANKTIAERSEEIKKLAKELEDVKHTFEDSKNEIHSRHARQVASQDSQLMALSAEIQQKNEEITKSSIVISKLEEDLCAKNGIIEKLRLELENFESQKSSHTEASSLLNVKLNELSLTNGDLQRQLASANERINGLLELKQRLETEIQGLTARCENGAQLEQLRAEIQQRESMLERAKAEFEQKLQNSERLRHEIELQRQQDQNNFAQMKADLEAKLRIALQSEESLKQRCDTSVGDLAKMRDEYRMKIDELQHAVQEKDLTVANLQNKCSEAVKQYEDQLRVVNDELNRRLQECQQKISSFNDETANLKQELAKKSEQLIEARAESSHILAQRQQLENELKQKYSQDTKQLEFELNGKNMELEKALTEVQLLRNDCQNTNSNLTAKDDQISELAAQVKNAQNVINQLQEELTTTRLKQQQSFNEHENVQNQCKGLLDQVASLTEQVKNGEAVFKNLEIEHKNAMQLVNRLRITEQQKQQCLQQLQQEASSGGDNKNCDHVMQLLNQVKVDNTTGNTEKILNLQKDLDLLRNQLAERNHQFDVQQNELLRLQQELVKAQQVVPCVGGSQEPNSVSLNDTHNTKQHNTLHAPQPSNLVELQVQLSMLKNSYGQLATRFDALRKENAYLLARLQNAVNNGNPNVVNNVLRKLAQANQQYNAFRSAMQGDNFNLQKTLQNSMLQLQDRDRALNHQNIQIKNLQQVIRSLPTQCRKFAVPGENLETNDCSNLSVDNKKLTDLIKTKDGEVQNLRKQISSLLIEYSNLKSQNNVCIQKPCLCAGAQVKEVPVVTPSPPKIVRVMVPVVQPKVVVKEVKVPQVGAQRCPPPRIERIEVPKVIIQKVPLQVPVPSKCTLPDLSNLYHCDSLQATIDQLSLPNYSPTEVFKFKQTLLSLITRQKNCMASSIKAQTCTNLPKINVPQACVAPSSIVDSLVLNGFSTSAVTSYKENLLHLLQNVQNCALNNNNNQPNCPKLPTLKLPETCFKPLDVVNSVDLRGYSPSDSDNYKQSLLQLLNKLQKCSSNQHPISGFSSTTPVFSNNLQNNCSLLRLPLLELPQNCLSPSQYAQNLVITGFNPVDVALFKESLKGLIEKLQNCNNYKPVSSGQPQQATCGNLPKLPTVGNCLAPPQIINQVNLDSFSKLEADIFKQTLLELLHLQQKCCSKQAPQVVQKPVYVRVPVPQPPKVVVKQVPRIIVKQVPVPVPQPPRIITKQVYVPAGTKCKPIIQQVPVKFAVPVKIKVPVRVPVTKTCQLPNIDIFDCSSPNQMVGSLDLVGYNPADVSRFKESLLSLIQKQRVCVSQGPTQVPSNNLPNGLLGASQCDLPDLSQLQGCLTPQMIQSLRVSPKCSQLEVLTFKQTLLGVVAAQRNCVRDANPLPSEDNSQGVSPHNSGPKVIVKEVRVPVRVVQPPRILIKQVPVPVPQPPKIIIKQVPVLANKTSSKPLIVYKEKPVMVQLPPRVLVKQVPVKVFVPVQTKSTQCQLPSISINSCSDLQNDISSLAFGGFNLEEVNSFKQNLYSVLMQQRRCSQCHLPDVNIQGCEALDQQIGSMKIPGYNNWDVDIFKQKLLSILNQQRQCSSSGNSGGPKVPQPPRVIVKHVPVPQPPKVIFKHIPVFTNCDKKPVPSGLQPSGAVRGADDGTDTQQKGGTTNAVQCHLPNINIQGCADLQKQIDSADISRYDSLEVMNFKQNLLTMLLDQRKCSPTSGSTGQQPIYIKVPVKVPVPVEVPKEVIKEVRVPVPVPQPPKIIIKQVPVQVPQPPRVIIKQVPVMTKCDHKPNVVVQEKPVQIASPPRIVVKQVPVRVPASTNLRCHLPRLQINNCEDVQNVVGSLLLPDYDGVEVNQFKQDVLSLLNLQRNCIKCKLPDLQVIAGCHALQNQVQNLALPNYNSWEVQSFKQNLLSLLEDQRKCVQQSGNLVRDNTLPPGGDHGGAINPGGVPRCVPQIVEVPKEVIKEVRVPAKPKEIKVYVPQPPKVLIKQVEVPVPQPPKVIIKEVPVRNENCNQEPRVVVKEKPVHIPVPGRTITKEIPVRVNVPVRVPVKSECHLPILDIHSCDTIRVQSEIDSLGLNDYSSAEAVNFKQNLLSAFRQQRNCVQCRLPQMNVAGCEDLQKQVDSIILPNYNSLDVENFKRNLITMLLSQRNCMQKQLQGPNSPNQGFNPLPNSESDEPRSREQCVPKEIIKEVKVPVPQPPKIVTKEVPVPQPPKIIIKEVPVFKCDRDQVGNGGVPDRTPSAPSDMQSGNPGQCVPKIITKEVKVPVKVYQTEKGYLMEDQVFQVMHSLDHNVPLRQCAPKIIVKEVKVPTSQPPRVIIKEVPVLKCDRNRIGNGKEELNQNTGRGDTNEDASFLPAHLPQSNYNSVFSGKNVCDDLQNEINSLVLPLPNSPQVPDFKQKLLSFVLQQRKCVQCTLPSLGIGGCQDLQNQVAALSIPNYISSEVQTFKTNLLNLLLQQRNCVKQPNCEAKVIKVPVDRPIYHRVPVKIPVKQIVEVPKKVMVPVPFIKQVPVRVPVKQIVEVPKEVVKEVRVPVEVPREVIKQVPVTVRQPPKIVIKQVPVAVPQPPKVIIKQVPVTTNCDKPNIIVREKPVPVPVPSPPIVKQVPVKVMVKSECHLPQIDFNNLNTCGDIHSVIASLAMPGYNLQEVDSFKSKLLAAFAQQRNCAHCRLPDIDINKCEGLQQQVDSLNIQNSNLWEVQTFKHKLLTVLLNQRNCAAQRECRPQVVKVPVDRPVYKEVPVKVPVKQIVEVPKEVIREVKIPVYKQVPVRIPVKQIVKVPQPPKILIKEVTVPVPQPPKIIVKQVPIVISKCTQKPRIVVKEKPVPIQLPPRTIIKEVPVRVKVPVPVTGGNDCHLPTINLNSCGDVQNQIASLAISGYNVQEVQHFKQNLLSLLNGQRNCVQCHLPDFGVSGCTGLESQVAAINLPNFSALETQRFKQNLFTMLVNQRQCGPLRGPIPKLPPPEAASLHKDQNPRDYSNNPNVGKEACRPRVLIKEVPVPVPQPPKVIVKQVPVMTKCDQKPQIIIKEKPVPVPSKPQIVVKEVPVSSKCHLPHLNVATCDNVQSQIENLKIADYSSEEVTQFKRNLLSILTNQRNCGSNHCPNKECHLPNINIKGCAYLENQVAAVTVPGVNPGEVQAFKQNLLSLLLQQQHCQKAGSGDQGIPSKDAQVLQSPRTTPQGGVPVTPQGVVPITPQGGVPISPQGGVPITPQGGVPITPQGGVPITPQGGVPITAPQGGVPISGGGIPTNAMKGAPRSPTKSPFSSDRCVLPELNLLDCENLQHQVLKLRLPGCNPTEFEKFQESLYQLQRKYCTKMHVDPVPRPGDLGSLTNSPSRISNHQSSCHLPRIGLHGCTNLQNQIESLNLNHYELGSVNEFKQNLLSLLLEQRRCKEGGSEPENCRPKIVKVPQPPRIIVKHVPVYIKPEGVNHKPGDASSNNAGLVPVGAKPVTLCPKPQIVVKEVPIVRKVFVLQPCNTESGDNKFLGPQSGKPTMKQSPGPNVLVKQVPVYIKVPKIVEKQVPVRVLVPPKVIIKEVKVPMVNGKSCPPPKVVIEKVPVPQPPQIITKPVLVSVPCNKTGQIILPTLPLPRNCERPENVVSAVILGGFGSNNLELFKRNLLQLLKHQQNCDFGPKSAQLDRARFPSKGPLCQARLLKRVHTYASQLCRYKKLIKQLQLQLNGLSNLRQEQLPAVPLPMLHVMKSVSPSVPLRPFQHVSSVSASRATFVRNLNQVYRHTQAALQHCMDAILAQSLTHSQINAKCNNCHQLIQDKEMAENQIKFLNSIIVDMQKKTEEQRARIEILESGYSPAMADELKLMGSPQRQVPPRVYCDICEEFDLHETEDCPKQNTDLAPANGGQRGEHKHVPERPYCEICEAFGHATEDCQEDQTF
ncbi:Restin homolog-like Protein [Tribolium castaneum]|uniref:Restin homolog-like Protein n=1 Tax=Tribolium castaneum TaxID=7070 RepID=A0A139WBE4_TRICA|nr:Restin homolog-like Protein [Tribolium castaneum]